MADKIGYASRSGQGRRQVGHCQSFQTTTKTKQVMITMVPVTAMPKAAAIAVNVLKPSVSIKTPISSNQLTSGI